MDLPDERYGHKLVVIRKIRRKAPLRRTSFGRFPYVHTLPKTENLPMIPSAFQEWSSPKRLAVIGTFIVAGGLVLFLNLSRDNAPARLDPVETTRSRLAKLMAEASSLAVREQRLPDGIPDIVTVPDDADGWGRAFVLTTGTEGPKKLSFVIRSSGADGELETNDDWIATVRFGDDGYGKLGPEFSDIKEPGQN